MELTLKNYTRFHDCVFEVTGISKSIQELQQIFDDLPTNIKFLAETWGLSDTEFNNLVFTYLKGKKNGD